MTRGDMGGLVVLGVWCICVTLVLWGFWWSPRLARKERERKGRIERYEKIRGPIEQQLLFRLFPKYRSDEYRRASRYPIYVRAEELKHTVVVFLIINEKPLVMEDDIRMYPSDELVAKIRLILG